MCLFTLPVLQSYDNAFLNVGIYEIAVFFRCNIKRFVVNAILHKEHFIRAHSIEVCIKESLLNLKE